MQSLQNVQVARLMAREREASLRRTSLLVRRGRSGRPLRRWLGRQLVRAGTWLANEQPMRPARAR